MARNRYIKSVEAYNVSVRTFPNNLTAMIFGYQVKPNFSVENEKAISVAPKVDFSAPAQRAPAPTTAPATAPVTIPAPAEGGKPSQSPGY